MTFTTTFCAEDDAEVIVTFAVAAPEPDVGIFHEQAEITDVEPAAYWGEAEDALPERELVERAATEAQDYHLDRGDHLYRLQQEAML